MRRREFNTLVDAAALVATFDARWGEAVEDPA